MGWGWFVKPNESRAHVSVFMVEAAFIELYIYCIHPQINSLSWIT